VIGDIGHVESIKEVKCIYTIAIGETGRNNSYFGNLRSRWENYIQLEFKETE
jgi:hypothetical protein